MSWGISSRTAKYRYACYLYHLAIECPLTPQQSGQPSSSGPPVPNAYRKAAAAASASRLASQARPNQPQPGLLSVHVYHTRGRKCMILDTESDPCWGWLGQACQTTSRLPWINMAGTFGWTAQGKTRLKTVGVRTVYKVSEHYWTGTCRMTWW